MADYHSLLARAVASLPQSSRETRAAVFERARKALLTQLRAIQPPVAEADIAAEGRALDEAIARIEAEAAAKPSPAPFLPPPKPFPPAPSASKPAAQRTAPPSAFAPKAPPAKPAAPARAGGLAPLAKPDEARKAAPEPRPAAFGAAPEAAEPPRERQRPAAPLPPAPAQPAGSRRILAITAILIVLAGVVALAAWHFRERPEDLARLKPDDQTAETAEAGKFGDRVDGAGDQGATGGAVTRPQSPGGGAGVPVAQKAELWVASLKEPNKVDKVYSGVVVWRLDNVGGGPGEPVGSAIRGDAEIPDGKLKLTLVFQKNLDAALSASHTINVSFKLAADSDLQGVKAIGPIQMRRPDAQSGEKVYGIPVTINENNFLIGLMRGDREPRNLTLLRSLMVIDLPMLLADGRGATISLEKGPTGERVFADAIEAWGRK
jgi:hypothetical protein